MGYVLREGTTFCRIGERIVFLDIPSDRYFCLTPPAERSFRQLVDDGPPQPDEPHLLRFLAQGLLIATPEPIRPHACHLARIPEISILDTVAHLPASIATAGALTKLVSVRMHLRLMGLGRTLSWISRRKTRLPDARQGQQTSLAQLMAGFVAAAHITSISDDCLAHSLAVAAKMIGHGIAPEIVLGVKLGPFSAHCWVQHEANLVNDRFDVVRNFTPIAVI